MPTSVRLDAETQSLLQRLARVSGRTKSEVIRDALHQLASATSDAAEERSTYALIADLVGIADGGPDNLARDHKKYFRERLRGKR